MVKKFLFVTCLALSAFAANAQTRTSSPTTTPVQQQGYETTFDSYLKAGNVNQLLKDMSARPHHVGSPGDKAVADYIFNKFKSWGFDTRMETFYVLFPTPKFRLLEMTGPVPFKAGLTELPVKEDATSGQTSEQLPTYNCFSADGDVTGELVFVNYGIPDDYERLQRLGIDVKGKIVIAKYGRSWRGIKPKLAQEHGAIGCIIYSDPKDDGYYQGDVYPKGAFKNEYGAQRGSVLDMPVYPGDPLTPGVGAVKDAKRLDRKDALTLLKIPVLPIGYHDAEPLLRSLQGPVAPEEWRGALPITYHIGPGKSMVHLKLEFDWQLKPVNNIIAQMPGSDFPDEWVIRGNHHDAWVNGAADPLSGQAAMMEEARAMSELAKTGWKPKRTIMYCAWDGEEPGLLGSTEWAEYHADELQKKAVVYINSDGNGRGFLGASGSHALEPFINDVAKDVMDPETGISILERRHSREIVTAVGATAKKSAMARKGITIGALGSGSDYSPFIQHLGVASLDLGFGGEDAGGDYHSIYDSYDDYRRFKDSSFQYGVVLAKTAGRCVLKLADAPVLPFDFKPLYRTINGYATELIALADQMRETTAVENQLIKDKRYKYAEDPSKKILPPTEKDEVPFMNFSSLQNALAEMEKSATALSDTLAKMKTSGTNTEDLNKRLYQAEQKLLSADGLPRRPWYKHTIYAPGFYTGYGVKTLPGIREALEQRNWKEAQEQIEIASSVFKTFSNYLTETTQNINKAKRAF